jgi:hypothetical protein
VFEKAARGGVGALNNLLQDPPIEYRGPPNRRRPASREYDRDSRENDRFSRERDGELFDQRGYKDGVSKARGSKRDSQALQNRDVSPRSRDNDDYYDDDDDDDTENARAYDETPSAPTEEYMYDFEEARGTEVFKSGKRRPFSRDNSEQRKQSVDKIQTQTQAQAGSSTGVYSFQDVKNSAGSESVKLSASAIRPDGDVDGGVIGFGLESKDSISASSSSSSSSKIGQNEVRTEVMGSKDSSSQIGPNEVVRNEDPSTIGGFSNVGERGERGMNGRGKEGGKEPTAVSGKPSGETSVYSFQFIVYGVFEVSGCVFLFFCLYIYCVMYV